MLCKPLVESGLTWVYFAMMGLIAVTFSIIGGIFTTKAKLYEAKDNDFLLSMPVSTKTILFVRMVSLYLFSGSRFEIMEQHIRGKQDFHGYPPENQ